MPNQIIVLDHVLKRLETDINPDFINVYGIPFDEKIFVVGFGTTANTKNLNFYPAGIDHIGLLEIKNNTSIQDNIIKQKLKDVQVTNTPLYFEKNSENGELKVYYFHDRALHTACYTTMTAQEFKERFCFLNLLADITVGLPIKNKFCERFSEMQTLVTKISEKMVFRVEKSSIFISPNSIMNQNHHSTIGKMFDSVERHKDFRTGLDVLNIYGFFPSTIEVHNDNESSVDGPLIIDYNQPHNKQNAEECHRLYLNVELPFDGLCIVHRERSIHDLYSLLIDTAVMVLHQAEFHVNRLAAVNALYKIQNLCVYHFSPEEIGHPLSLIYIHDKLDNELKDLRIDIHKCLCLPLERPLFKKGCAMKFLDSSTSLIPLMNVHIGLRNSGLKGTNRKVGFVNGFYEYYHYMQMDMNDSGWGCAYRSLQTIVSWFILQGYTTKQIPSHKKIQEILVEIGDKEQKFLGSKTWIGSTEVAYVLESYLINISSIIINIPSGSEMYTMAPVLFDHFKFHGTPVMIGGGVAAHTLIGIDYNEETSEVKFLILDPHYIGEDDLTTIQKKGGVSWKGIEFWNQNAFYNLCFPQRPICV